MLGSSIRQKDECKVCKLVSPERVPFALQEMEISKETLGQILKMQGKLHALEEQLANNGSEAALASLSSINILL